MKYSWREYQAYANAMAAKIDEITARFGKDDFDEVSEALHEASRKYKMANAVMEYALFKDLENRGMALDGEAEELDRIPGEEEIAEIDALAEAWLKENREA